MVRMDPALSEPAAALVGPSWSVSGGAVPESLSASASALAPSQEAPSPATVQPSPDSSPPVRSIWLEVVRATPLALRTNPESMLPLTYGKLTLASVRESPVREPVTLNEPALASPVPVRRGSGGATALNR